VVRLDQPYRNYAVDLLAPQQYPKDGGEPYDERLLGAAGPLSSAGGASADPSVRSSDLINLTETPHASGRVIGSGSYYVLKDTGQEGLLEARYRLAQFNIEIAERPFSLRKMIIRPDPGSSPRRRASRTPLRDCAANLGLDFNASASVPNVAATTPQKRRGLESGCRGPTTDSIGWVRTHSINAMSRTSICVTRTFGRAICRQGRRHPLNGHVDLELAEQIHGIPKEWGPMPYKKTAQTPVTVRPPNPTTSQAESAWRALRRSSTSWKAVVCS